MQEFHTVLSEITNNEAKYCAEVRDAGALGVPSRIPAWVQKACRPTAQTLPFNAGYGTSRWQLSIQVTSSIQMAEGPTSRIGLGLPPTSVRALHFN
jgi:hypothetical protein